MRSSYPQFKSQCCLTIILKRRGKNIDRKRALIQMANPLHYALGYQFNEKESRNYGFGY